MRNEPRRKSVFRLPLTPSRLAACVVVLTGVGSTTVPSAEASDANATHYYVSLGDSLAASVQPNHDYEHGYAEQLYAHLLAGDSKLEFVKLGCSGESTASMRFGSQPPDVVLSCGTPRHYRELYPKGTQLDETLAFLQAHKDKVSLVTIDIGSNDLTRLDAQGNTVICLFELEGCDARKARMVANLTAILGELRAADPDVPIVGMTYYNVFAKLWFTDPVTALLVDARVADLNAAVAATYAAFGIPVADVAGSFENGLFPNSAIHVCDWTWFCSQEDVHPNTAGYAVIAHAFEEVLP